MLVDDLKKCVTVNGEIIPSRCRESYIKKHSRDLHNRILNRDTNFNFKENLKLILSEDSGYCPVCGNIKKMKGNGSFPVTCSPKCSGIHTRGKKATHKKVIDKDTLEDLYINQKLSPKVIGEKFGCSNVTVLKRLKEYGIKQRSHSEQVKLHHSGCEVWNYTGFDRSLANDIDYLMEQNKTKSIEQIAGEIGCKRGVLRNTFIRHNKKTNKDFKISYPEQILNSFLDELNIDYIHSDVSVLEDRKELDIYIPSKNIAIEVNGLYWHCDKFKDSSYHLDKTKVCENNNIQLLHFWDSEVLEKTDIVKSMIKAKMGLINNKIYARCCDVRDVNYKDTITFINNNHIQGAATSKISKGLYYKNELVALATFMKPRFKKGYD